MVLFFFLPQIEMKAFERLHNVFIKHLKGPIQVMMFCKRISSATICHFSMLSNFPWQRNFMLTTNKFQARNVQPTLYTLEAGNVPPTTNTPKARNVQPTTITSRTVECLNQLWVRCSKLTLAISALFLFLLCFCIIGGYTFGNPKYSFADASLIFFPFFFWFYYYCCHCRIMCVFSMF